MLERLPKKVKIVEVGPRDGLQNETAMVATEDKLRFIQKLSAAGLTLIEATSFVRADRIPQMANGADLFKALMKNYSEEAERFPVLVPNMRGLENALACGATHFSLLTATSEAFSKKNANASIAQSLEQIAQMVGVLRKAGGPSHKLRIYISTAFGCPYQGKVQLKGVMDVLEQILQVTGLLPEDEIALGDTIGVATPTQVNEWLKEIAKVMDLSRLALHFHDTRGMALANILVGLERGVSMYDSSAGGLGGCPYAGGGATGNVATEEVVYLLESMGVATGVDLDKLMEATSFILQKLGRSSSSRIYNVLTRGNKK